METADYLIANAGLRDLIETTSAVVTAVATSLLAVMACVIVRRSGILIGTRAHVTVNIEPNPWAINQVDLLVANSGTAAAYDVEITFDPPLPVFERQQAGAQTGKVPLQHISLLRSAQLIRANLCQYAEISDTVFSATVSWRPTPASPKREATSYRLLMADYAGAAYVGARL